MIFLNDIKIHTKKIEISLYVNLKLKDNHLQRNLILICTLAPCHNCSQEIIKYPIKKVIYLNSYRDNSGIKFLKNNYIEVMNYSDLVKNSNEKYIDKK
jgi:dCMP deaminase